MRAKYRTWIWLPLAALAEALSWSNVHFREAFKFAFSLATAYMIAMAMDWDRPHWAALAVIMCSLPTAGASLNKGIMRIAGCTFGCICALVFVELFAQERFHMMLAFLPFIFVLALLMLTSPYAYAYKKTIILGVLIVMGAYGTWDQTLAIAVARTSETITGVLVYMVVSALLWPRYAGDQLDARLAAVLTHLADLHDLVRRRYSGEGASADFNVVRRSFLSSLAQFEETLTAAHGDTAAVRSRPQTWEHLRRDIRDFYDATILLYESFDSFSHVPIPGVFSGASLTRVSTRLARICDLSQSRADSGDRSETAGDTLQDIDALALDPEVERALSFEERATLLTFVQQIGILDAASEELLAILAALKGRSRRRQVTLRSFEPASFRTPIWDSEVWLNAFRPVLVFVFVFLGWIYIIDLPGGPATVTLTIVVALFVITEMPADPIKFAKPFAIGLLATAPAYFFVLPWLETPYGLFSFLFLFSFPWGYLGSQGNMFLKFFVMLTFVITMDISNSQVYSFLHFTEMALLLASTIIFTSFTFCFLPSSQPEKVFLRMLRSFFRSCARFVAVRSYRPQGKAGKFPRAEFLRARVNGLPLRMRKAASAVDYDTLRGNTMAQVFGLLDSLQSVSFRLQALENERDRVADPSSKIFLAIHARRARVRMRLEELLEGWARLEDIQTLRYRRLQCEDELRVIEKRLYDFGDNPEFRNAPSLEVVFGIHATTRALMNALERLEHTVHNMDLIQWACPRFSKP